MRSNSPASHEIIYKDEPKCYLVNDQGEVSFYGTEDECREVKTSSHCCNGILYFGDYRLHDKEAVMFTPFNVYCGRCGKLVLVDVEDFDSLKERQKLYRCEECIKLEAQEDNEFERDLHYGYRVVVRGEGVEGSILMVLGTFPTMDMAEDWIAKNKLQYGEYLRNHDGEGSIERFLRSMDELQEYGYCDTCGKDLFPHMFSEKYEYMECEDCNRKTMRALHMEEELKFGCEFVDFPEFDTKTEEYWTRQVR